MPKKLMIASDIHGSAYYCEKWMDAIEREEPDKILLLGDLLYHGPRNPLPQGYDPKAVAEMLNKKKEKIICVRGNCDTEVDQMLLETPILADYSIICWAGMVIYATHGHHVSDSNLPPIAKGEVLLCGHTHIPACKEVEGVWYLNPGSVSIPKENSWHGYMVLEDNIFLWKDLDGAIQKEHKI